MRCQGYFLKIALGTRLVFYCSNASVNFPKIWKQLFLIAPKSLAASARNSLVNRDVRCLTVFYCIKQNKKLLYDAMCDAMPRSSHVKTWKFSALHFSKHSSKMKVDVQLKLEMLQRAKWNIKPAEVMKYSPNEILNQLKFLPCKVLREIIAYINIGKKFICFRHALSKELLFRRTYFRGLHEFSQIIKNYVFA